MKCPFCNCLDSKVVDSRLNDDGTSIRRRRECTGCAKRYTTYEKIESTPVLVIKNNGNRQIFDSAKIKNGIIKACEKRPVSMAKIDKLVNDIEKQVNNTLAQEISSKKVGDMVMNGLKTLDDVAYVRYASVHRQFKDINTLLEEIEKLVADKTDEEK
ncbi:MAG: transcriptional repressor NrdR [Clostridia bacterium]|nr:transcriptional repressor NrdR [Clostridia bacterium]